MNETILVTGSDGFVGKNLLETFLKIKKKVILICFLKNGTKLPDSLVKSLGIKIVYGDITRKEDLERVFNEHKIDYVIHLAAIIHSNDLEDFINVNIHGTRNLVEISKRKIKKIIFISTDLVLYSNLVKNYYTETKRAAQEIIKRSGIDYVILYPTPIYGKYDWRNFGSLAKVVKKYKIIPYVNCFMQPVNVLDVVDVVIKCLFSNVKNKEYYLPGKEVLTLKEIFLVIMKKLKLKRRLVPLPMSLFKFLVFYQEKLLKTPVVRYYQLDKWHKNRIMDYSKAVKELNYKPSSFSKTFKFDSN